MTQHAFRLNAIAALCACWPLAVFAADEPQGTQEPAVQGPMNVVVVTGSRSEHASFDLPAAIDVIDAAQIRDTQPRVNASEALAAVPGLLRATARTMRKTCRFRRAASAPAPPSACAACA